LPDIRHLRRALDPDPYSASNTVYRIITFEHTYRPPSGSRDNSRDEHGRHRPRSADKP